MIKYQRLQWKTVRRGDIFNMDLLKFFTAGSVDDGKSTLIGRLLYTTANGLRLCSNRTVRIMTGQLT